MNVIKLCQLPLCNCNIKYTFSDLCLLINFVVSGQFTVLYDLFENDTFECTATADKFSDLILKRIPMMYLLLVKLSLNS